MDSFVSTSYGEEKSHEWAVGKGGENRVNPGYVSGEIGYSRNCQTCVPVYEARRRGLDIENMANYIKDVGWLLDAAVVNLSESAVEAAIKANTDFQYQAGLRPKVIRISSGNCCEWCDSLEGEYEYPNVPPEVWQRHKNCNCVVEYDPGDGRRQDAHTEDIR